jgi:cysteine dioxygenase
MLKGLVRLIRYMDGLNGPAEMPVIDRLLREADVNRDDLVQACNFSDVNYARTIFAQSPWYQLIVICWRSGQSSPIHDHRGSQCGVRVVAGTATETVYERTPAGAARAVREVEYHQDDVCTTSDTGMHVISNRQPQTDLVTLHLYSPPLKMTFYEAEPVPDSGVLVEKRG